VRNRKQTQLLRRRLIPATVRDQAPSDRLVPSPLLTTAVVGWLLVAAVAAGVTIAVGPGTPLTTVTYAFVVAQLVAFATLLTVQLVARPRAAKAR